MRAVRLIRRLPEAEAIETWLKLHLAGKHKGIGAAPGPDRFMGKDATWVEVEIPHTLYNADWNSEDTSLSQAQIDRALRYAAMPGRLPPGMATFSGRRGVKKVWAQDGNHRAYAAYLRGEPAARFLMPFCHWERFLAAQTPAHQLPRS